MILCVHFICRRQMRCHFATCSRLCAGSPSMICESGGILFDQTRRLSGGVAVLTVTFPVQNEIPGIGGVDHWQAWGCH